MLDRAYLYVVMFAGLVVAGVALGNSEEKKDVAPSADKASPLASGTPLPPAPITTPDGVETDLRAALGEKAGVVVFYRGHWCPACMKQLQGLNKIVPELKENGAILIAVATDKPEIVAETVKKTGFDIPLYSDNDLEAAKALGLAYQLEGEMLEKYGPTLVENTGHDTGQLPVPAVFVVDKEGVIKFVYANPDYKVRLSNEELLAEVKKLKGE